MDAAAFDRLSRTLWRAGSRRAALGTLLTTAGAILGLAGIDRVTAQGECQGNGERCDDGDECCSGRCKRRNRDKHGTCRQAANQGECTVADNICPTGSGIGCGQSSGGSTCHCFVTVTGRSFCGASSQIQPDHCDCTSNKQCEQDHGKDAKCVQAASGGGPDVCGCQVSGTGCMGPCDNLSTLE